MKLAASAMVLLLSATSTQAAPEPTAQTASETQGRDSSRAALALGESDPTTARAMLLAVRDSKEGSDRALLHAGLARLAFEQGELRQADLDLEAGLAALGPAGSTETRQSLTAMRATVAEAAGDDEGARRFARLSTSTARTLNKRDTLREALVEEARLSATTAPKAARSRLQEARELAEGDADEVAAIDEQLAALPAPIVKPTVAAPSESVFLGLDARELTLFGLPLLFFAFLILAARNKRGILAGYTVWGIVGLAARSLLPIYGQLNLLGWRRAVSQHADDGPAPSISGSYATAGITMLTTIWGPPVGIVVAVVMASDAVANTAMEATAGLVALLALGVTFLLAPLLHHIRDTEDVLPFLRPGSIVRLLVRHPLQCMMVVVQFSIADIVIMFGNMLWFFGGTLASTIAVGAQGSALHRFNSAVADRQARRAPERMRGAAAGGSPSVVPSFDNPSQ